MVPSPLGGGLGWGALIVNQPAHPLHKSGYLTKMGVNVTRPHLTLVEILMQVPRHPECDPKVGISRLFDDAPNYTDELRVTAMIPPALLGDGLDNLRGRAPPLLTGLQSISTSKLL